MKLQLLNAQNVWDKGVLVIRIITGIIILKYGLELFDKDKTTGYSQWLTDLRFPLPLFMTYIGKAAEFIGGLFLIVGLFTRVIAIPLVITMLVITFIMGQGKILGDDQHPFLLMLLFLLFLFIGGGKWSLDYCLFNKNDKV